MRIFQLLKIQTEKNICILILLSYMKRLFQFVPVRGWYRSALQAEEWSLRFEDSVRHSSQSPSTQGGAKNIYARRLKSCQDNSRRSRTHQMGRVLFFARVHFFGHLQLASAHTLLYNRQGRDEHVLPSTDSCRKLLFRRDVDETFSRERKKN